MCVHRPASMHVEFSEAVSRENAVIMPSFLYTRGVYVLLLVDIVTVLLQTPIPSCYAVICYASSCTLHFFPDFLMPWDPVFKGPFLPAWDLAISSRAFLSSRRLVCGIYYISKGKRTCLLLELVGLVIFVLVVLDLLLWLLVVDGVGTGWVGLASCRRYGLGGSHLLVLKAWLRVFFWSDLCGCSIERWAERLERRKSRCINRELGGSCIERLFTGPSAKISNI